MFSGIVESKSKVLDIQKTPSLIRVQIQKPEEFQDLKTGDSICCNGVCLTIENFDNNKIQFAIAQETLAVTQWQERLAVGSEINLERSLKFGDRIHGHLVTGHVDGIAKIVDCNRTSEGLFFSIELPQEFSKFVWKKGSLCVNGVSLTVNDVKGSVVSFYLIPETLKKTNLAEINKNDWLHFEVDMMAKAAVQYQESKLEHHT